MLTWQEIDKHGRFVTKRRAFLWDARRRKFERRLYTKLWFWQIVR